MRMPAQKEIKLHNICFFLGFGAALAMLVPYLILGQDAIVTYHDQLDGELIGYMLQAKHLFDGNLLPEFMNGADKTALTLPAPGFVLLFLVMRPFWALVSMQLLGSLCGYVGMYLLTREIPRAHPAAAMAVGILYAYLPFLPVYGLSQYGLPLLFWSFLQLRNKKYRAFAFGYSAMYALCSSLVLIGFGVIGMGLLWTLLPSQRGRRRLPLFCLGMMTGIYVVENFRLLGQLLGWIPSAVSHKEEYVLTAEPFWNSLLTGFLQGGQHSGDYHQWILGGAVLAGVFSLLTGAFRREKERKILGAMGISLGVTFLLALVSALWDSGLGILLRTRLSVLGAFQADRLLWLAPCLWYLLLACELELGLCLLHFVRGEKRALSGSLVAGRFLAGAGLFCFAAVTILTGVEVLRNSNLKPNVQKLRNPDYGLLSFRDYYAIGVMEQVEAYLLEQTGEKPEDYRVVSLGIDPAAALYQGFYCLDGYSNNYSLEYKHSFREIIAPELEKSQYLQEYFDDWGNRCYLFSAECPGYYTIEKNGFYFQDYALDVSALKELGGKYLLSAAWIENGEETGLRLVREEPFETRDSYYRIFLYEIL